MKKLRIVAIAAFIVVSGLMAQVARAQQPGTKRTDLQRHDLSSPGREIVQVRVDFDPGYVAPRHTHFGEEIIYVLEGSLEYHIEGQAPVTVNGAELATYVVEKGKPLITLGNSAGAKDSPNGDTEGHAMIITSIHYTFASKDADKAESLFRDLRNASVKEPGVIQFEVGRSTDDPNVFALWEVYRDKGAVDAHLASEHFKRFVLEGIRPLAQQRNAVTMVPVKNK